MRSTLLKTVLIILVVSLPWTTQAGILNIDNVQVQVQPLDKQAYKMIFYFEIPKLPDSVAIDYAELSFGINIIDSTKSKTLEILSTENEVQGIVANYNSNPVTEVISKNKLGLTKLNLDITQLLDMWVNHGVKNKGISLVSHRKLQEKALRADRVLLAPEFKKASVRIFYTVME